MPPFSRSTRRLTLESVLIVLSILLAFALNGWWEGRQQARLATRALASFEAEIGQNRARLQEVMPYHARLREQFSALGASGSVRSFEDLRRVEGFTGFRPAFLTTTAWRSSLASGALTHLDYEILTALSELYTLQEGFSARSDPTHLIGVGAFSEANIESTVISAAAYLGDVTYGAQELLQMYDAVLERLQSR
jgi:hypothetical protein